MADKTAYQRVKAARRPDKITTAELINHLTSDFFEQHGDRLEADDPAIIGGIGLLNDKPITVVGIQKGSDTDENIARHFGSPTPQGYRKALRLMKQAEKFHRPILALVNTPGAWPDVESEYHGQGSAVAQNIIQGMQLRVPYITIIVGEGGSGGALALSCGDRVFMFEDSIYSVLSPEGYASIMWKDSSKVKEAAEELKLTPEALLADGIIDKIIHEYQPGEDLSALRDFLDQEFSQLAKLPIDDLVDRRNQRYRNF
ncbi:carboxyltransferase subunit alpha [Lentilactobacillus buchneri]|uniref:carboxyltransferase subunit alpha n=1 Tax=Lentilactobacillus buchneri TaxID=1581 RepID=UPI0002076287|nr:carboxyltransferase subunit alpha [Lentilactobacillus buchneri]WCJ52198.1 acetyl-CoA carboxylase carboxyl transferase subunit alpha [Lentilactobacillus sp. Egmn17]AEB73910.1 Acetyl-CoA carboxylase [Lentilactobacillus buchneri NRRL B-30929]MCT2898642.1 acetyl-CoA carboxylase carboxyl transferase subunit alpha [Lentilactobacillus buchneri]MCT3555694.1 acetyl-CoA carboxylase carboxyl transferase subunit alpha [Lentilactobacillus buchneri]MCT3558231.1 acetyl-CoA carboxylase carboxyl transferase